MGIGNNPSNIGKLFSDFLLFYGNLFEFNYTVIDVNMDKYEYELLLINSSPYILCSHPLDAIPTILDPITYLNAGKSSYRTIDIKRSFSMAFDRLNELKTVFEKKQGIIHENFVNLLLRTEIKSNL
jgi:DNA polymerase sigma